MRRHNAARILMEALEDRRMMSAAAPVAVAEFHGYALHNEVMGPNIPVVTVGNKASAPGQKDKIPVITPVLPPPVQVITLANPSDLVIRPLPAGATLWGNLNFPTKEDVRQNGIGDCWCLGPEEAMSINDPGKLINMMWPDGNGGYCVRPSNGSTIYIVSGDFGTVQANIGPNNALWPLVLEKYAACVMGSFNALNGGWMTTADNIFGWTWSSTIMPTNAPTVAAWIDSVHTTGGNITLGTNSYISDGAPIVPSHCYVLDSYSVDGGGNYTFHLYQPWGVEYAVTISFSTLYSSGDFYVSCVVSS